MPTVPLHQVALPDHPAQAADLLLRATEQLYRDDGGPAIAPLTTPATAHHLPATVPDGTALVLSTSGSTGTPKRTALPRSALLASGSASLRRLGGPGNWLLCLPVGFVAGFQVISRAVIGGTRVTTLDSRRFDTAAFVAATRRMGPGRRYTALVPTQITRLLADPDARAALAGFDQVMVGGAPLPEHTAAQLRAVTGVVTTYGMTETGGGCVYDGVPLDGVSVRIVDEIVHIGGDTVATGYLGATPEEHSRFSTHNGRRWYRTSDRGRWDDDHRLVPLGRTDDLINTGGLKISAGAVEQALLDIDGIDSAVVMGLPDPEWGELVSAHLVLKPGAPPPDTGVLRKQVRERLGPAAIPKRIVFHDDLPLLANSKIDRSAVRARLSAARHPRAHGREG